MNSRHGTSPPRFDDDEEEEVIPETPNIGQTMSQSMSQGIGLANPSFQQTLQQQMQGQLPLHVQQVMQQQLMQQQMQQMFAPQVPLGPAFLPPRDQPEVPTPPSRSTTLASSSQSHGNSSSSQSASVSSGSTKSGRTQTKMKLPEVPFEDRVPLRMDGLRFVVARPQPKMKKNGDVSGEIGAIMRNHWTGSAWKNAAVDDELRRIWWDCFRRRYRWASTYNDAIFERFNFYVGKKIPDMIYDSTKRKARKNKPINRPGWLQTEEQWEALRRNIEQDPVYAKTSMTNQRNRMANGGGPTHGTGRSMHAEVREEMIIYRKLKIELSFI